MRPYFLLQIIMVILGTSVFSGWMIVDIYGTEKLDPSFAVMGLLIVIMAFGEMNHMSMMKKLNEPPKPN